MPGEAKVLVPETVPLAGGKLSHLLDAVRRAMEAPGQVQQLAYRRGEPLRVDRLVASTPEVPVEGAYAKYIRHRAVIEVIELAPDEPRAHLVLRALHRCREQGAPPRMFLCRSAGALDGWMFPEDVEWTAPGIFGLPVVEDPDVPRGHFGVCGSSTGTMVEDVERCILCRVK